MTPLDADIGRASALVIDPNPASRSVLVSTLREAGVARVEQIGRLDAARRLLEGRRFDIVLTEYHFADEARSGMDLVEDVRLAQLLPMNTVFLIVSAEARSSRVAEAAEAALDGYVLKPHTQQALLDRLRDARLRKRAIAAITDAVARRDYAGAAALCDLRVNERGPCWLMAARIGAELRLKMGQTAQAQALFDTVVAAGALPWAKLGLARTQYQAGDLGRARRTLESLLSEQPGYADAYDAMGRVQVDQCEFDEALATFKRGCELTPGSVGRLQKYGLLAFMLGRHDEAAAALERANALGQGTSSFDLQSLALLGLLQFDRGELAALGRTRQTIARAQARHPDSARLRRLDAMCGVLLQLQERRVPEAMAGLRGLLQDVPAPDFDLEAACNLLALLSRVQNSELRLGDVDHHVDRLARRFAVSKATTELMCRMARAHAPLEAPIREAYRQVCSEAEAAVAHSVAGQPQDAVKALLVQIERSLNGKLMDLAAHTLRRHRDGIPGVELLELQLRRWRERYGSYGAQVRLGLTDAAGGRMPVEAAPAAPGLALAH